jgi:uncharacterized protein with PQ loop repeat
METDKETDTKIIVYHAISISIIARFVFMYLMYTKKSTNNYSLLFCLLNITSSCLWIKYSFYRDDYPLLYRSCIEIFLLSCCVVYILKNKYLERNATLRIESNTTTMI